MKRKNSGSSKPDESNLGGVIAACTTLVTAIGGIVIQVTKPQNQSPEVSASSKPVASSKPAVEPSKPQINPSPVRFKVGNRLGHEFGQVSEKVTLLINGRLVADLNVNMQYPTSVIEVNLPSKGTYSYTANGRAVFRDGREYSCAGQGFIDVSQGKFFAFAANMGGGMCQIVLVE